MKAGVVVLFLGALTLGATQLIPQGETELAHRFRLIDSQVSPSGHKFLIIQGLGDVPVGTKSRRPNMTCSMVVSDTLLNTLRLPQD